MSFDNRIFNVNGQGKEDLLAVLKLAFKQEGTNTTAKAYVIDPKIGMILLWYEEGTCIKFPSALKPEAATEIAWSWLNTSPEIQCVDWDADYDHDGDNSLGWRVYCEGWGHVASKHAAIVAIKPAYLWHGK